MQLANTLILLNRKIFKGIDTVIKSGKVIGDNIKLVDEFCLDLKTIMYEINNLKNHLKEYANFNHSLSWKKNSRRLLLNAKTIDDFKYAVLWCGKRGNVSRTVKKTQFDSFVTYLWGNKDDIKNGLLDFERIPIFDHIMPLSFVSKVCHIINPKSYPIIYDKRTRRALNSHSVKKFIVVTKTISIKYGINLLNVEKIFQFDSAIWAFGKDYLDLINVVV